MLEGGTLLNTSSNYVREMLVMYIQGGLPSAEGIVIYKDNEFDPDKAMMAKLRRDMFPWYYWDKLEIHDLDEYWIDYARRNEMAIKGYS